MESSPYTAPNSSIALNDPSRDTQGRWLARIGVALYTGPVWGLIGTIVGMIRTFSTLAESGNAKPDTLAFAIDIALTSMIIGIILGLVGAIMILVAFLGAKNRENWFFKWSVPLSVIWSIVVFPFGAIVGGPILILFLTKRTEFVKPNRDTAS